MSMSTEMPRDTRKTQTYLPDASSHDALLDFAEVIRQFEEAEMAGGKAAAALVDPQGNQRTIPVEIFRILDQVANALAAGQGITIIPQGVLMTTQQAADFLGVSRPTVVRLLESGEIDFEKPGHHRRVRLDRLLDFQERSRGERRSALKDLQRSNLHARVKTGSPRDVRRVMELDA